MEAYVLVVIAAVIAAIAYSYLRQFSFSLVASATCGAVFLFMLIDAGTRGIIYSRAIVEFGFRPEDLIDPSRFYTVLTSMFTHASFGHLFMNVIALAFLGMILEQRIGTRQYILIFLFAGVCGTLSFAAFRWNEPFVLVVGASGAISGVLGALVRMYPHERMTLIFFPRMPLPLWTIICGFLLLQLVMLIGDYGVAVEAHLGGLVAGMFAAPYFAKAQVLRREKRTIPVTALRKLATTHELKAMLARIENEEIPDVRSAWIEKFVSVARCPVCGAALKTRKAGLFCDRGHLL
ncbi:MAG: rhomboid family intramembrane serine protease [Candidatus Thermoplasmatota archaeon]|nr:rhomboid family intramembrane serine protease [Candidatus Thermoplasmatota archaeon]